MKDDKAAQIQLYTRDFSLVAPAKADANGLVKLLVTVALTSGDSLDQGNVLRAEGKSVVVGGRKDGAAMNVAQQNCKANMETWHSAVLNYMVLLNHF